MKCTACGKEITRKLTPKQKEMLRARGRAYCSPECSKTHGIKLMREQWLDKRVARFGEYVQCATCGKQIETRAMSCRKVSGYSRTKAFYCSLHCAKVRSDEALAKAAETRRKNGFQPIWVKCPELRGGNGKITEAQQRLCETLEKKSKGWTMELPIRTGGGEGYPSCYKVDVGNAYYKIAVECDGHSHDSPKMRAKDKKKEKKLEELGWKVLRFSNSEILKDLGSIVTQIMSTAST